MYREQRAIIIQALVQIIYSNFILRNSMSLFDSLNSHEQVSLIWITIFIIGMLSIKNIRLSAAKLIRIFFKSKLLFPLASSHATP
jgi:hypothetical protein